MKRRTATLDRAAGARLRAAAIERLRYLDRLYGPPGGLLDAPCMGSGELRAQLDVLEARNQPVPVTLDRRYPDRLDPDPVGVPDEYRVMVTLEPDDSIEVVEVSR